MKTESLEMLADFAESIIICLYYEAPNEQLAISYFTKILDLYDEEPGSCNTTIRDLLVFCSNLLKSTNQNCKDVFSKNLIYDLVFSHLIFALKETDAGIYIAGKFLENNATLTEYLGCVEKIVTLISPLPMHYQSTIIEQYQIKTHLTDYVNYSSYIRKNAELIKVFLLPSYTQIQQPVSLTKINPNNSKSKIDLKFASSLVEARQLLFQIAEIVARLQYNFVTHSFSRGHYNQQWHQPPPDRPDSRIDEGAPGSDIEDPLDNYFDPLEFYLASPNCKM